MQARLTGAITPKYADGEQYPGRLLVVMDDGHVLHYDLRDEEQKNACFIEAMDILQRLPLFGGRKYRRGQKIPEL